MTAAMATAGHRPGLRSPVRTTLGAVLCALLIALAGPSDAATKTNYKNSKGAEGVWYRSSGYVTAYRNQVLAQSGFANAKASNGVFTASAMGGVVQTFSKGRYKLKCGWTNKNWQYTKINMLCTYFK